MFTAQLTTSRLAASAAILICVATLASCGSGTQKHPSEASRRTLSPRSSSSSIAAERDSPTDHQPSDALRGRGPVLVVANADYQHTVQIVDAVMNPTTAQGPAPSGLTYIQLVLKVAAREPGRAIKVPAPQHWGVQYAQCSKDQRKDHSVSCGQMDGGSNYYTARDMQSDDFGPGIALFGTLAADTVYYTRAWQLVAEKANLSKGTLCETRPAHGIANCIPLGEVRTESDPTVPVAS